MSVPCEKATGSGDLPDLGEAEAFLGSAIEPSNGDVNELDSANGAGTVKPCNLYLSLMLILPAPAGDALTLAGLISTSAFLAARVDAGLPTSLCSEIGAITGSLACKNSLGIGARLAGALSNDLRCRELRRGGGVLDRRSPCPTSIGREGIGLPPARAAASPAASVERAGMDPNEALVGCVPTSALLRADVLVPRDEIESQRRPNLGKLANRELSGTSRPSFDEKMLVPNEDDLELPERPRRCREPTLVWKAEPCSMS